MHVNNLHFYCGLPRTGSTLVQNILQQNPAIFTTSTDPFPIILKEHILTKSRYHEPFQAMDIEQADNAMYGMAMGATIGWYAGLTTKPVIISKSRSWVDLHHLFPNNKIIVGIRDLRDIVNSFDKLNSKIKAYHTITHTDKLYGSLTDREKYSYFFEDMTNAFGYSLHHELPKLLTLKQEINRSIYFMRYEDLIKDPVSTLKQIYKFLDLPYYNHDLNNIKQSEMKEWDNAYFRERTSHKVDSTLGTWSEPRRQISANLQQKIVEENKWYYKTFYPELL